MSDYTVYTYIYGELDEDDNIVYVGKSNYPRQRHIAKKVDRFKILDKYIDIEQRWIHQLSSSGVKLRNKEVMKYCGDFKVGEIYNTYAPKTTHSTKRGAIKRVRHIPTQRIFESKYAASRYFGEYCTWCKHQLDKGDPDWEIISNP